MAIYSIDDHEIRLNSSLSVLTVFHTGDNATVATYVLTKAMSISTSGDDYLLSETETTEDHNCQGFDPANSDSFSFSARLGIGISDLRTVRCQFNYHLDACPIVILNEDGVMKVYSPCPTSGSCTQPSATCCTITEID